MTAMIALLVLQIVVFGAILHLYRRTKLLMRCVAAQVDQQAENEKFIEASREVYVTARGIEKILSDAIEEEMQPIAPKSLN